MNKNPRLLLLVNRLRGIIGEHQRHILLIAAVADLAPVQIRLKLQPIRAVLELISGINANEIIPIHQKPADSLRALPAIVAGGQHLPTFTHQLHVDIALQSRQRQIEIPPIGDVKAQNIRAVLARKRIRIASNPAQASQIQGCGRGTARIRPKGRPGRQ